jgi:4-amino-4-deoxy-L-arabinose transferase-like glycosyltransferase
MKPIETTTINHPALPSIQRWFYVFIMLYIALWTLAPTLVRFTLPMDAIEGAIWGHQLEWGYDKNPFLNAWLTALAQLIDGQSGWTLYLFSQISVGIAFWAVWRLGVKIMPPIYALIGVLVLASTQYYNLHAIDFNDNTLELSLWTLTTLFFYQALQCQKYQDWLLTGLFAGLSMMTKYYFAVLLIPMFLFMLLYPQTRAQFKKPGFLLAYLTFLLIVAPHIIWLYSHDFTPIEYALHRVSSEPKWINHIYYPAKYIVQQFEVFLPALFLFLMISIGKNSPVLCQINKEKISGYDRNFLLIVGMGPFFTTLFISLCTGINLRAGWGQPLLALWGLLFLAWARPILTQAKLKRFLVVLFIIIIGMLAGYSISLMRAKAPSSANFPGKIIATEITQEWHAKYHSPLKYVVGARWLAGNIAFYSNDHPTVYIDAMKPFSPWIDEAKIKREGAIFVWDASERSQMDPDRIKIRFAKLSSLHVMHFSWLRNKTMKPVEISVAFLPPAAVSAVPQNQSLPP